LLIRIGVQEELIGSTSWCFRTDR